MIRSIMILGFLLISTVTATSQTQVFSVTAMGKPNPYQVQRMCTTDGGWMLLVTNHSRNESIILFRMAEDSNWTKICASTVRDINPESLKGEDLKSYYMQSGNLVVMVPLGSGGYIIRATPENLRWLPNTASNILEIHANVLTSK